MHFAVHPVHVVPHEQTTYIPYTVISHNQPRINFTLFATIITGQPNR